MMAPPMGNPTMLPYRLRPEAMQLGAGRRAFLDPVRSRWLGKRTMCNRARYCASVGSGAFHLLFNRTGLARPALLRKRPGHTSFAVHCLEISTVPKSLRCPANIVLPGEEHVPGIPEFHFVQSPNHATNLDNACAAAETAQRLDSPFLDDASIAHAGMVAVRWACCLLWLPVSESPSGTIGLTPAFGAIRALGARDLDRVRRVARLIARSLLPFLVGGDDSLRSDRPRRGDSTLDHAVDASLIGSLGCAPSSVR